MSEITLPCEIGNSDEEVTFQEYKRIEARKKNEMSERQFSKLMESCGDSEVIENIFAETAHIYHSGYLPAGLVMKQADNPSWETILWGQSFAKRDGKSDEDAIWRIVEEYDAEDFDLEQ